MKTKYAPYNDDKRWKPKLIYVMYNKKTMEKIFEFKRTQNGFNYSRPSYPCMIQQSVTSQNMWDTLMYVGGGTKAKDKWKPSKVTILDWSGHRNGDPLDKSEAANLFQLLHS